ncbi:MAG TPA: ABC transporter ATP-binding protein [Lysinibacillus sp.]|uniref:ABC transporter ATP-binding protein n=1 Tax=Lysinibacillus fusiformis TaxID=28031 RepID=A0A2I0V3X7_9BACI|nr:MULTISPECIES: ABC transporter ATP-binding protein [Lysinibacillus]HBT70874.1 ABC transporter ATP-binding protein [Lysinibacillus sp.]KUF36744.1 ABC transporter [Lysinibacillus sp. F5]MEE3807310.1 ABC transporter ATP-binding protein [Lysinibacillus fusiformis]PKU53011.1 ABC transporter ATP-binding protein [Lysinibacillus fusiformis]WCH49039.1 ABC transporter ATP-binding protein [Lysinibacillus sp. OF-1]
MEAVLKLQNISKKFNDFDTVLQEINLSFFAHTFNVILGQSGCGKSTLINIMSGLMKPTRGNVYYKDLDISHAEQKEMIQFRRYNFSNIFQDYLLLSELTVRENIELGKTGNAQDLEFRELIARLGIETLADRFPNELSGGQQQRVSIARAMIKNPEILFCDEATGALDEHNSKQVVDYLKELNKTYGTLIIFSTHNLKISTVADRIIVMKDGLIEDDYLNTSPRRFYNE